MQVFLSWSGPQSGAVARALRGWLPLVIQAIDPWMSEHDIGSGQRWSLEIASQLDVSNFGVICATRENQASPWLNFEAGALAKKLTDSFVCPYLVDLDFSDLTGPLAQFQARKATEE